MTLTRRQHLAVLAAGIAAAATGSGRPRAQVPVRGTGRIFAGFPAGGTLDNTSRRFAEVLRAEYPDGIIVENRVGAGGRLAVDALKAAAPDGLGMLVSPDSIFTIYPFYYKKLAYDPVKDIAPVSPLSTFAFAFAVGPKVPAEVKRLADFVGWVKANPADAAYASPATGSMPHFLGNELSRLAGLGMRHVAYRGSAPALQDLVGGHIASCMTTQGDFLPHISTGKMRFLGVTGRQRSRFLPDTPTFIEQGLAVVGSETYGLFLSGQSAPALVDRFAAYARKAAADPEVVKTLAALGMDATATSPADYRGYLDAERATWGPIVKASGFSSEE